MHKFLEIRNTILESIIRQYEYCSPPLRCNNAGEVSSQECHTISSTEQSKMQRGTAVSALLGCGQTVLSGKTSTTSQLGYLHFPVPNRLALRMAPNITMQQELVEEVMKRCDTNKRQNSLQFCPCRQSSAEHDFSSHFLLRRPAPIECAC